MTLEQKAHELMRELRELAGQDPVRASHVVALLGQELQALHGPPSLSERATTEA